jgi:hypothetical protein
VSTAARESRTVHLFFAGTALVMAVQLRALRDTRCRYVQGWLIGRPMAIADLREFLDAFDPALLGVTTPKMDTSVHLVGQAG